MTEHLATASATYAAPASTVWKALTEPELVRQYMFGFEVETTWRAGDPIAWKGEWNGKKLEDKGQIVEIDPGRRLRYTHYSATSGKPDVPENYHTVLYELTEDGDRTTLDLTQYGSADEEESEESSKTWQAMLDAMRPIVEK